MFNGHNRGKKKRFLLACPQNDENDYLKAKNIMDYTRLNSILMGSHIIPFLSLQLSDYFKTKNSFLIDRPLKTIKIEYEYKEIKFLDLSPIIFLLRTADLIKVCWCCIKSSRP